MSQIVSLRQMHVGQQGKIATVEALGEMNRRIRDMGLIPGTTVSVVGRAAQRSGGPAPFRGDHFPAQQRGGLHQGRCVRRGPLSFYPSSVGTVLSNLASVAVPCGGGRDVLSSFGEYRPSAFVIRTVKQKEEL